MKEAETGVINENSEVNGFSSVLFFYNMGTLLVVITSMPILACISHILKLLKNKHKIIETAY